MLSCVRCGDLPGKSHITHAVVLHYVSTSSRRGGRCTSPDCCCADLLLPSPSLSLLRGISVFITAHHPPSYDHYTSSNKLNGLALRARVPCALHSAARGQTVAQHIPTADKHHCRYILQHVTPSKPLALALSVGLTLNAWFKRCWFGIFRTCIPSRPVERVGCRMDTHETAAAESSVEPCSELMGDPILLGRAQ